MAKGFCSVILLLFLFQIAAYSAPMFVAPSLLSISPPSGNQGQVVNVVIQGGNFSQGATIAISGTGVTVASSQVASSTSMIATFSILATATAGGRNVTVTTSGGTSTAAVFTVNAAAIPTLTATSVPNANPGQTVNVTLTGTNFVPGGTFVGAGGVGIGVSAVNVTSPTSLTATLTVAAATSLGGHNLFVTTAAGLSNPVAFTVLGAPTLTSVVTGFQFPGRTFSLTLTGTNFTFGATTASIAGSGITVDSIVPPATAPTSVTSRVVTFTAAPNAPLGAHNITVTTPGGPTAAFPFSLVANTGYTISTIAGSTTVTEGGAATSYSLPAIRDVARDSQGNTYIATTGANKVYKVTPGGAISIFAGTGAFGPAGDGGPSTNAQLSAPQSVAVDGNDNVYIAEGNIVRKIATNGTTTTFAGRGSFGGTGSGAAGFAGDGGPASYALLNAPGGLSFDAAGNLYIVDQGNNRIRKVTPGGTISTVAGNGIYGFGGDGAQATAAQLALSDATKMAVDSGGNLYIPDSDNHRIRKVTPGGIITTFAGTGVAGFSGDTGPAVNAQLSYPTGIVIDNNGNFFISDSDNQRIRKIGTNLDINTVAGDGGFIFNGDGPTATSLHLSFPVGLAVDGSGNVYFADFYSNRVRSLSTSGALGTIAGNSGVFSGDNGQATQARLYKPQGVAVDANNNILIADTAFARVRRVSAADGTITTIAGNGNPIITSNSGTATTTAIGLPFGVAVGPDGSVYIAAEDVDLGGTDSRIWKVAPDQTISTIAGGSLSGYSGDNGPATAAQLNGPTALAVDASGNVYIADSYNYRVRRINASDGKIVTVAGTGVFGLNGDNGPATAAQLSEPKSLALDPNGNLYIGDLENGRVRMVAPNGTITTFSTAGGSAVAAGTAGIFVANRQRIFQYFPDSVFAPISGLSGTISGISGDNNGAITALITVMDMAVTSTGAVIFVDDDDNVIRKLTPVPPGSAVIGPLALGLFSRGGSLMSTSQTLGFAVDPNTSTYSPAWTATASVTTPNGGTWLSVSPTSGNGTSNVSVTGENTGLAAGSYQGAITITCATCVNSPFVIPMTLTILPASIGATPNSYVLTANAGGFITPALLNVFNAGIGGDLNVSVAASTITPNGGNWLSISPSSLTVSNFSAPGTFTPTIDTTGLAAGVYTGAITLTSNGVVDSGTTVPVTLTLAPPGAPTLTSITPINATLGQTVIVTLTGSNFVNGGTVAVTGSGVTVGTFTPITNGTALVTLTIDPGAPTGARNLTVTTSGGTTFSQTFTILGVPTLTSISPAFGYAGQNVAVNVNGTNFPQNATAINVTGSGVTIVAIAPTTSTTVRVVTLAIDSAATPGVRTLSVSTPAGTTSALNFSVTPPPGYAISTYAGQSIVSEGGTALSQPLPAVADVTIDSNGNYYLVSTNGAKVFKINPGGVITTFAGTGITGPAGDGGAATAAQLNQPHAAIVDANGNVLIADLANQRVRKVAPNGTITTFAGTGTSGFTGDGGPALYANLSNPSGLGIDSSGNVYIIDAGNRRIRKVDTNGVITTVAGTGVAGFFGDGLQATLAQLQVDTSTTKLAVDGSGNLYIPDAGSHRIRKVAANGIISTIAGTGVSTFSGDNGLATAAALSFPRAVILDANGNLIISDNNNNRIRRISNGIISTIAGNGGAGFNGDGPTATALQLTFPLGLALDLTGNILIADQASNRLRRLTPAGVISTLAGSSGVFSGDGLLAHFAPLYGPEAMAFDLAGNLLIADSRNYRIRKVDSGGTITTIAGTGVNSTSPDGTLASAATIAFMNDIFVDGAGNIYLSTANRIRKINASDGKINTIAGTGTAGSGGDGGLATAAQLSNPQGIAMDGAGNIYIADASNHKVRKINASDGKINTIAGTGTFGAGGDNGPATSAQLNGPRRIALDSAGNIYIADNNNNRIRRIAAATQTITTFTTFGGRAIVSDGADGFLISSSSQIQHVFADGTATLIAGIGFGFAGDGGSSLMAPISAQTLAFAPSSGKIYFGDNFDNVVRQLAPISGGTALMSASVAGINSRLGHAASTTVTFNVALNGSGAFTWSASTSIVTGPAGSQWLTVPPGTSGTRGDPIAVTVSAFGLPLGVYNGSVTITSPQATNSPLVLPVTLTVLPSIINTGSISITASANVGGPNPAAQAFAVTNGGSGVSFSVNAAAQITTPPGGTWLTVSPGTGNTGSLSLTESFTVSGLGSGIYNGAVNITSAQAANSPVIIPVTLTVNPTAGPTLSSIGPITGTQGDIVSVLLTGANFHPGGNTINLSGSGITVGTVGLLSGTSLYTTFTIAGNAAVGDRTVSVTTANGTSGVVTFTVVGPKRARNQITSQ